MKTNESEIILLILEKAHDSVFQMPLKNELIFVFTIENRHIRVSKTNQMGGWGACFCLQLASVLLPRLFFTFFNPNTVLIKL